jgi:hypothetical protein
MQLGNAKKLLKRIENYIESIINKGKEEEE